jgi:hypothetical protein
MSANERGDCVMAKLERYRELIQSVLLTYAESRGGTSNDSDLELQVIFDPVRDRYLLVHVGWYRDRRIYGTLVHLEIRNEKVWLQLNSTEDDFAAELMAVGIPKDEIVLGFQAPEMRQFTEFAIG